MNPFINADIKVESIEAKMASTGNMKYIITDQNKKKYYFFEKNKNGTSETFNNFKALEVKKGDIVHISFTEEEKGFTDQSGKLVNYTDRFIGSIREAGGNPQVQQTSSIHEANKQNREQFFKERNFEKEAYAKCLSIWAAAVLQNGAYKDSVEQLINDGVFWSLFQTINKDADKRFSPMAQAALATNPDFFKKPESVAAVEEAPLPEEQPLENVEDIPW